MNRKTQPRKSAAPPRRILLAALLCAGFTLMAYGNTFEVPFQLDDEPNIVQNISLHDMSDLATIWNGNPSTRFLPYITFALNYDWHGTRVLGYHIVNILIHFACGMVFFFLAWRLLLNRENQDRAQRAGPYLIALFSALVFLVHPLQTQAVTYIVQRVASLAALFYLATLLFYVLARVRKQKRFYAFSMLAALAASFSKETAFTLPFAILLIEFFFGHDEEHPVKNRLLRASLFFIPLVLVFMTCYLPKTLSQGLDAAARLQTSMPRSHYLFTQFHVLATYWRMLFIPLGQNLDHDYPVMTSLLNITTLLFLFLHGLLISGAFFLRKKLPELAFGILWFYLTLGIESSIIPIKDVIFEHRLYLPMAGFALGLSATLARGLNVRVYTGLVCLLVITLTILSFQRNRVWKDEITLWTDVVQKSPEKHRGRTNLGRHLSVAGRGEEAFGHFQKALEIDPGEAEVLNNMGSLYAEQGRYKEAIQAHQQAAELAPQNPNPVYNLGHLAAGQGRTEEAMQYYRHALELHVRHKQAMAGLAVLHQNRKEYDQAEKLYRRALKVDPHYALAHYNLGLIAKIRRKYTEAVRHFLTAARDGMQTADLYFQIGDTFLRKGDLEQSRKHLAQALILEPKNPRANLSMGLLLAREGEDAQAKQQIHFLRTLGRHDLANRITEELVRE